MKRNSFAAYGLVANGMIAVFLAGCASGGSSSVGSTQPQSTVLVVAPTTGTLRGGATQSFTVSGNGASTVTWSVEGVPGGNTQVGTISAVGLYTAPTFPPTPNSVTITATETADAGKAASALFTLQNPVPQITSISPASIPVGAFTLAVTGSLFATGAVVQWTVLQYVSSTQLTATGTATNSQVGTVPVTVDNPDPGSIPSAAVNAQVTAVSSQLATATAAARFLDQSSFGPTATTIAHVQQIGQRAALTEQFAEPTTLFSKTPSPDTAVCGFTIGTARSLNL